MTRLIATLTIILVISSSATPLLIQDFIDCLNVIIYFGSCIGFIDGHVSEPTWTCCAGVQELNRLAQQNRDAQKICQCIEFIAAIDDPPFLLANINALPYKCNVHLSFPISVNKNCSGIR
ncbi:non-specific lipid-transfer protein 13-like [Mercurialis annua]|uniref:non-specific lipid-transfer protein 13-like n=1 Tax=Mercurialis annua TaxID=3986 RepID=UPI002160180D|nr:non-specific lipid-transfer protein 13-like [Mercurialis annua]